MGSPVMVGAMWYSIPFIAVFSVAGPSREGRIWVGVVLWSTGVVSLAGLMALKRYPRSYETVIHVALVANVAGSIIAIIQGGPDPSGVNSAWTWSRSGDESPCSLPGQVGHHGEVI